MIRICCKRDYLADCENMKYVKVIRVIIKHLSKLQVLIKEEKGIEVNWVIILKDRPS